MGLDGSPEVGVQGPRVLLSGHQGGHRAPRMGRRSAPRAPSSHVEPRDQQTPAQSGPMLSVHRAALRQRDVS